MLSLFSAAIQLSMRIAQSSICSTTSIPSMKATSIFVVPGLVFKTFNVHYYYFLLKFDSPQLELFHHLQWLISFRVELTIINAGASWIWLDHTVAERARTKHEDTRKVNLYLVPDATHEFYAGMNHCSVF
jgi:hypothetical protein